MSPESLLTVTGSLSSSNLLKTKKGFRNKLQELACSEASNTLLTKDESVYLIKEPQRAYKEHRACTEWGKSPLTSKNYVFPGD